MPRVEQSGKRGTEQAPRVVLEELMRRRVVYASVCEKEDEKVVRGSKVAKWPRGKRGRSDGAASWLTGNT